MKMNKLAKLKTRKGGLGKNEHPGGLTTFEGNSGKKQGQWKEFMLLKLDSFTFYLRIFEKQCNTPLLIYSD